MKKYLIILLNILAIANTAWAEEVKWEYNPYDFQYDMTVYIRIHVDGSPADISRYSITAFCDDECRGIVETKKSGETQYGYLRVRSNKESGEQISFKVYDNETGDYLKCSEMIDFISHNITGLPSSPMELNAANKYKIEYFVDEAVYKTVEVYYGETITLIDAPEKEGHTFAKWIGIRETMPAHDVIVTGSYTVNSYKLIFVIDDEIISETMADYGSEIVEPTVLEEEGHTFAWERHPTTMPAKNLTIMGEYTANIYTVTYKIEEEIIRIDNVEYGSILPDAPDAPERPGLGFYGWCDIPSTMPAENIIIIGIYQITTGIYAINENLSTPIKVYNLQGKQIGIGVNSLDALQLPLGIYIVNGHKIVIR